MIFWKLAIKSLLIHIRPGFSKQLLHEKSGVAEKTLPAKRKTQVPAKGYQRGNSDTFRD